VRIFAVTGSLLLRARRRRNPATAGSCLCPRPDDQSRFANRVLGRQLRAILEFLDHVALGSTMETNAMTKNFRVLEGRAIADPKRRANIARERKRLVRVVDRARRTDGKHSTL
jgi:hypothetical protein